MRRGPVGWVVVVVAATVLGVSARIAVPEEDAQEVLQRDVDAIREAGVTGVQARVTTGDGQVLVATSGVADVETREPVPADGHYRIASNTKTFVATVILQLVGEGRVSLDDPVEQHLPGVVSGEGNDGAQITIRDLLQHTSGIYDYNLDEDWNPFLSLDTFTERRFDHYELEDLVVIAMRHPPAFEPGTEYQYSNTNYILAGMVIEAVTGNRWDREVVDRVIEPLGLEQTSVPDGPDIPDPHAKGYSQFQPGDQLIDTTRLDPSAGGSGGAIISTPEDMTRFFTALLGDELLAPQQMTQMRDTVPAGNGRYGLGLGWSPLSCGAGYWRHGGAVPGYLSYEGFTEDGSRGVVIVVSTMPADDAVDYGQAEAANSLIDTVLCEGA